MGFAFDREPQPEITISGITPGGVVGITTLAYGLSATCHHVNAVAQMFVRGNRSAGREGGSVIVYGVRPDFIMGTTCCRFDLRIPPIFATGVDNNLEIRPFVMVQVKTEHPVAKRLVCFGTVNCNIGGGINNLGFGSVRQNRQPCKCGPVARAQSVAGFSNANKLTPEALAALAYIFS